MRSDYSRKRFDELEDEVQTVISVMTSCNFILLDLLLYSLLFCFVLSPILGSFFMKVLAFITIYLIGCGLFLIFKKWICTSFEE